MNKELEIQQLISYVSDNCSAEEQKSVEAWIKLSRDNEMLYTDYKQVWESTSAKKQSILIDVDSRWESFKQRANFDEGAKPLKSNRLMHYLINASKVAAVIVFLFSIWLMFDNEKQSETIYYSSEIAQNNNPYSLPDGSHVTLNVESELDYPESFASDIREVNFKGEAFFDIAHNPEKPLIIASDNIRVKVLGTSFNLCNSDDSDEITVHLDSGKVLFYSVDAENGNILQELILLPGELGVYNKSNGIITKSHFIGNNHNAWKTGQLDFINAPLTDVVKVLEHTYNVKVNTELQLEEYHLTACFNDETTESIVESLQVIYGFDYTLEDNIVHIY